MSEARSITYSDLAPSRWLPRGFPEQARLLGDTSRLVVALCTRRAGKSYGIGLALFRAAVENPGCSCLYLGLTRESAKRTMCKDIFRVINRKLGLGAAYNKTELTWTLPNLSVIYILGMDATEDEKDKVLGQKFKAVVVDEAASFSVDLVELVYSKLAPATADQQGVIYLAGTPAAVKSGLFFELTKAQDPCTPGTWSASATLQVGGKSITYSGWSGHRWSAFSNPHMQWQAEVDRLKAQAPGIEETPGFQQDYFGRWVIDDSKLVYRYLAGRNSYTKLPVHPGGRWHQSGAVDLGYEDPTGILVAQWHDQDTCLYISDEIEKRHLDITDTAEEIRALEKVYPRLERWVIDGANKQAVEELRRRHGLELLPADKREKFTFIAMLNDELVRGRIKISVSCVQLVKELTELILNPKSTKPEENPACDNHLTDTLLYVWRYAYPYLSVPPVPPKFAPRSEEALREEARLGDERAMAEVRGSKNPEAYPGADASMEVDPWDGAADEDVGEGQ